MFSAGWRVLVTSLFLTGKLYHTLQGFSLRSWNFPSIPSPFWMQEAGLCAQRCLLWLVSLLFVSRQFIMPALQQEHRQEIFLSIGTEGSWPLSREQRELQQVVFSEATQTTLFFLAKIYPYFLWFRSGAVTHTLAERMLFQKQNLYFYSFATWKSEVLNYVFGGGEE